MPYNNIFFCKFIENVTSSQSIYLFRLKYKSSKRKQNTGLLFSCVLCVKTHATKKFCQLFVNNLVKHNPRLWKKKLRNCLIQNFGNTWRKLLFLFHLTYCKGKENKDFFFLIGKGSINAIYKVDRIKEKKNTLFVIKKNKVIR